jgi:hypothetical protein
MNDHRQHPLDPAIEELRAKRDIIDSAIRLLESIRDGSFMAGLPTLPTGAAPAGGPISPPMSGDIAPGTFHGMGIQEAVKKLLLLRKRTMDAPELSADLRAGGLSFAPKSIASVLHRSFVNGGDIVRKERGKWGLQEWYPNQRFNRRGSED